jgi:spore germination protein KB
MAFTGLLLALPIVAILAALLRKFPGKNLIEINDIVFGPIAGKAVSALYLFYFLSLAALNTRDLGNFAADYIIQETPIAAVMVLFLLGCAYALRKGIGNLMRMAAALGIASVAALAVSFILTLKDAQFDFLKPLFQQPLCKYVQGTVTVAAVPMGEILAFSMIAPMLGKGKKAGKPLALGLTFSAVFMAIVMVQNIISFGPLVSTLSLPSFESLRFVSIGSVLTRVESIYAVILLLLFLFKVSILLYAFVLGLSQVLRLKDYWQITLISAALVMFYALLVFESVMENMDWGATAAPFFSLTFELALPAVSLLAACLRKPKRTGEVKA